MTNNSITIESVAAEIAALKEDLNQFGTRLDAQLETLNEMYANLEDDEVAEANDVAQVSGIANDTAEVI